jgi:N-acetylneuraminic acid mutarotase
MDTFKNKLNIAIVFLSMTLMFLPNNINCQSVGIGTAVPNPSAVLELRSTNKGFLIPRMTTAQRNAIVNPTNGLQIYNTDDNCIDLYLDAKWAKNCTSQNSNYTLPGNNWRPRADFGSARRWAVGFSIGTKGYIGTGKNSNGAFTKDFWEYDPTLDVWTQKANFGGHERFAAVGFSIGTMGYIGTGIHSTPSAPDTSYTDFWEYNPITNIWIKKADFIGSARYSAIGFAISDKGYLGTGVDVNGIKKDFFEYNPGSNTWSQKADFGGTARASAKGFSIGSKGYIGTGYGADYTKDFWEYDPSSNTWVQRADFGGAPRYEGVGFSIGSKGYLGLGLQQNVNYSDDFWEYNPTNNSWRQMSEFLGGPRIEAVAFSIGSKSYVGMGLSNDVVKKDFYEYNTSGSTGKSFVEQVPLDISKYYNHAWTMNGSSLYTYYTKIGIGTDMPNHQLDVNGNVALRYSNDFEFGSNISGKEMNAGKIKYNSAFLDIYGAGTSSIDRRVKIYDRLYFDNVLANKKVDLFNETTNDHQFIGLGLESGTLRYQIKNTSGSHVFYAGTGATTSNTLMTINGSGNTTITGVLCATAYNCSSDANLKTNITPITSCMPRLLALNGYTYQWKDETKDQRLQSGLLAQEVEKYFPHLVNKDDKGFLSVNYIGFIPYMVEAMKEIKKESDHFTKENNSLISNIKALDKKREEIEKEFEKMKDEIKKEIEDKRGKKVIISHQSLLK